MQDPTSIVTGHERLTSIFGRWPSFHDAEVISIRLERGRDFVPALYATIHVCASRHIKDSVEFYNHTLVTFRFNLVVDLELSDFNQQNVIADLEITASADNHPDTPISVSLTSSYGVELEFSCRSVEIFEIDPKLPANNVYDSGSH